MAETNEKVNVVITKSPKSMGIALILAFLFGPLGMLYSTISGAIIMFIIDVILSFFTLGIGLFFTWPIHLIWAAIAVKSYNNKLVQGRI